MSDMRNHEFYFEDGTVTLLVDGQLFKVHRYYLTRESEVFFDMFSLPPNTGGSSPSEGTTDKSPIVIPEVSLHEMESFLGFMYFGMHDDHKPSLENWISLLSFATRFICDTIRKRAIREIEDGHSKLDPVERVVLAVRQNIPQWLAPAYQELCQRQESLNEVEGEKLGLSTVIKLMRARETLMNAPDGGRMKFNQPTTSYSSSQHLASASGTHTARRVANGYLEFDYDDVRAQSLRFDPHRVIQVVKQVFELE